MSLVLPIKFVLLFPPGLTYDEVISFVPPPLDQEEMESWETALFCLSHFTVRGRPYHRDSPIRSSASSQQYSPWWRGLCVLNWGGWGEGRKLSLCKHAACSLVFCVQPGASLWRPVLTAFQSFQSNSAQPVCTSGARWGSWRLKFGYNPCHLSILLQLSNLKIMEVVL